MKHGIEVGAILVLGLQCERELHRADIGLG